MFVPSGPRNPRDTGGNRQPSNSNNNHYMGNFPAPPPHPPMFTQVTQPPPPFRIPSLPSGFGMFGELSSALYQSCSLQCDDGRAVLVKNLLTAMRHDIQRTDSPYGESHLVEEANTALVAFLGNLHQVSDDDAKVVDLLISCADMDRVLDVILTNAGMNVRCYGALVSLLGTFAQNHKNKYMVRDMGDNSKFCGFYLRNGDALDAKLLYVFPKADNGIRFTQADTDYARDHPLATTSVVEYTRLHREQSAFGFFSFSSNSNHAGGI